MSNLFLSGSIRRQIAALAIGPILCLIALGALSEFLPGNGVEAVSFERETAIKIEMVIDEVRASRSTAEVRAVLDAASRTGLLAEAAPVTALSQQEEDNIPPDDIRKKVGDNLPSSYATALYTVPFGGKMRDVLVVGVDQNRALAFGLPQPPQEAMITNSQVSLVLQFLGLVLPVLLLSLYAANMIAAPLRKLARAAAALKPDEGPDRPFPEDGAREIHILAKALNAMHSRVRAMIDDRTRMLWAVSHDLRTPLTRLRLRAERSNEPELKAALLRDIGALGDMINDTLTFLSEETEIEQKARSDLPSLLETICSDFSDMGFDVSYDGPERLTYACKPRTLARAVTNLVENATRFAEQVIFTLTPLREGGVRITVMDDGPGIPPDLRGRVLEPFYKADKSRSAGGHSGFGLGLSIVDSIVRAHGGTIELRDVKPHGLAADICLPG